MAAWLLDSDTLWLPQAGDDSSYGTLNGTVVLCLGKPMQVKDFKLHIRGTHYINWDCTDTEGQHKRVPWRESIFYHQIWNFKKAFKKGQNALQPGNHKFPFSVSLNSRLPPTIEGLDDCFVRYKLTAELTCPWGMINESRSMNASKLQDVFSFMEPQGIEGFWDEKITYHITVPGHALPLGCPIKVDMRYIPLLKGLFAETMKVRLIEAHSIFQRFGLQPAIRRTRETVVAEDLAEFGQFEEHLSLEADGYQWRNITHTIFMPMSLKACRPTSRSSVLEVTHSLKVSIRLRNPSGKYSEISTIFPLILCPVPGSNLHQSSQSDMFLSSIQPPPAYVDHVRDQLYLEYDSPCISRSKTRSQSTCSRNPLGLHGMAP
ncbi:uncharacterized protein N7503_005581 [Penicillium pulvis]|uniref:uncharacterized protein n=1 Tax=Penicillium pulvis TaxID=1562058 RepID=UPI002548A812|nr:uncharacterized protein N7503_005581 [Penicillium pulvis]KAJ5803131.1 hypothetical protein N7503_005581 [Penicillium pulvis]